MIFDDSGEKPPSSAEAGIRDKAALLTWQPGDVILDLYEVRTVVEGLADAAEVKSCHRGGLGQVYKVYHRGWNLELAMKAPLPEVFENEAQVVDFTRECETWIDLGLHPHIVTCYYVRNLSGQPLVFAEYLTGGSLKDWIDSGLLYEGGHEKALKRILDIAIQSARGLHYAHEQGLVHQDVKPANIMLTPEGQAKISDFGTARARARAAAGTVTVNPGTILVSRGGMTPAYCSPEQSLGEQLTRRTDIWSWGLTVLEMFTGEVTWASGVVAAQALEAYLRHGGEAEEIPSMTHDLALLLERCFLREQERPQNFSKISMELEQIYRIRCGEEYPRAVSKAAEKYAGSLNNRALSMYDLGRLEEAERLWKEALKHDPAHLASTYNLGLVHWRSGKINDDVLIQRLEEIQKGQPSDRGAYLVAMVHAERLDYRSAVELLEGVVFNGRAEYEMQKLLEKMKLFVDKGVECLQTLEGHDGDIKSVCLSPDNIYALSGCWKHKGENTIKLWDVTIGSYLRTFEGHTDCVTSVCFSADCCLALSGSWDETIKVWDVTTGECLRTFEGHNERVQSVKLSTDGLYAISACGAYRSDNHTLKLWEVATGKCLRTFEGHTHEITSVSLGAKEQLAISGSWDHTLKLWEVATGKCLRTFEGHSSSVFSVCLSADGNFALSGSGDGTIKIWEIATGRCLRTLVGDNTWVNSVFLSLDNNYAISGSRGKWLKFWFIGLPIIANLCFIAQLEVSYAVKTEYALSNEKDFHELLVAAQKALFLSDYKEALLALRRARILAGRFRDHQLLGLWFALYPFTRFTTLIDAWFVNRIKGQTRDVTTVCLSTDNRYAFSGSTDCTLKLWDVTTGECLRTYEGHSRWVESVCLSADGCYVLSGSHDGKLKLWEVATGNCLRTYEGHSSWVNSVCLSADDCYVLSGSQDKKLKLWEVATGNCLRTYEGHSFGVNAVCLSAEGRFALSGSSDETLKLWEVATGRCMRTFVGHTDEVTSVCLSADGQFAFSGSFDETLKLWEVSTGKCLRTFEERAGWVRSVCLSADGRFALSGCDDNTIKLWAVATGKCLRTFEGHTHPVFTVCLSTNGQFALSSGFGEIILWELYWELE